MQGRGRGRAQPPACPAPQGSGVASVAFPTRPACAAPVSTVLSITVLPVLSDAANIEVFLTLRWLPVQARPPASHQDWTETRGTQGGNKDSAW